MNSGIWLFWLVSEVRVVRVNWVVWSGETAKNIRRKNWEENGQKNWVTNWANIGQKMGGKMGGKKLQKIGQKIG